jgi:hypothetical protein
MDVFMDLLKYDWHIVTDSYYIRIVRKFSCIVTGSQPLLWRLLIFAVRTVHFSLHFHVCANIHNSDAYHSRYYIYWI